MSKQILLDPIEKYVFDSVKTFTCGKAYPILAKYLGSGYYENTQLYLQLTTSVNTIVTDGNNIFINPDYVEKLQKEFGSPKNLFDYGTMFVLMHEMLHCILCDFDRIKIFKRTYSGEINDDKISAVTDHAINSILESYCGFWTNRNASGKTVGTVDVLHGVLFRKNSVYTEYQVDDKTDAALWQKMQLYDGDEKFHDQYVPTPLALQWEKLYAYFDENGWPEGSCQKRNSNIHGSKEDLDWGKQEHLMNESDALSIKKSLNILDNIRANNWKDKFIKYGTDNLPGGDKDQWWEKNKNWKFSDNSQISDSKSPMKQLYEYISKILKDESINIWNTGNVFGIDTKDSEAIFKSIYKNKKIIDSLDSDYSSILKGIFKSNPDISFKDFENEINSKINSEEITEIARNINTILPIAANDQKLNMYNEKILLQYIMTYMPCKLEDITPEQFGNMLMYLYRVFISYLPAQTPYILEEFLFGDENNRDESLTKRLIDTHEFKSGPAVNGYLKIDGKWQQNDYPCFSEEEYPYFIWEVFVSRALDFLADKPSKRIKVDLNKLPEYITDDNKMIMKNVNKFINPYLLKMPNGNQSENEDDNYRKMKTESGQYVICKKNMRLTTSNK